MCAVLLRLLPLGGTKSGNSRFCFGDKEGGPLSALVSCIMHALRPRPYTDLRRRHADNKKAVTRKRNRSSVSCCDPGTAEILHKRVEQEQNEGSTTAQRMRTESASGSFAQDHSEDLKEQEEAFNGSMRDLSVSTDQTHEPVSFDDLPNDCKLKIFSYLSSMEKGQLLQIQNLQPLLRDPSLWRCINFTLIPHCIKPKCKSEPGTCSKACYNNYKERVRGFMRFIQSIEPNLKELHFCFDFGDAEDRWVEALEGLLRACRCDGLREVHMNWMETSGKPMILEKNWPGSAYSNNHRRRQRTFTRFFDAFTCNAPNIVKLKLPFDWSSRSLDALGRLTKVESLLLDRYFVFQPLTQAALDQLFRLLPKLRKLHLEAWTPTGKGMALYTMKSEILVALDISNSRGFYVSKLDMPQLEIFKVNRHPYSGPLRCGSKTECPCVLDVLRHGAPQLKQLNEHTLRREWKDVCYSELETVLKSICSCQRHKPRDLFD